MTKKPRSTFLNARKHQIKTGHILVSDAIYILERAKSGLDYNKGEFENLVPCYEGEQAGPLGDKISVIMRDRIRKTTDGRSVSYSVVHDSVYEMDFPSRSTWKLTDDYKTLRRFVQFVLDDKLVGLLQPRSGDAIALNSANSHLLRKQIATAFCTSYILMEDDSGKIKPALITFAEKDIQKIAAKIAVPNRRANKGGRQITAKEEEKLYTAIERVLTKLQTDEAKYNGLKFSVRNLSLFLASVAGIPVNISHEPDYKLIAITTLERWVRLQKSLESLRCGEGAPLHSAHMKSRNFVANFRAKGLISNN